MIKHFLCLAVAAFSMGSLTACSNTDFDSQPTSIKTSDSNIGKGGDKHRGGM